MLLRIEDQTLRVKSIILGEKQFLAPGDIVQTEIVFPSW